MYNFLCLIKGKSILKVLSKFNVVRLAYWQAPLPGTGYQELLELEELIDVPEDVYDEIEENEDDLVTPPSRLLLYRGQ